MFYICSLLDSVQVMAATRCFCTKSSCTQWSDHNGSRMHMYLSVSVWSLYDLLLTEITRGTTLKCSVQTNLHEGCEQR